MSELSDVVGAAAGAANPITALAGLGEKLLGFIPNQADKLAAQAVLQEQQNQLLLAQLDQQTKLAQTASATIQGDGESGVRKVFGYAVVLGFVWDVVICSIPALKLHPIDIPPMFLTAFIAMILGLSGSPALQGVMNIAKSVALAPGDSSVSVFGFKLGNKS